MAGIETIWELHTLLVINSWFYTLITMTSLQFTHAQGLGYTRGMYTRVNGRLSWAPQLVSADTYTNATSSDVLLVPLYLAIAFQHSGRFRGGKGGAFAPPFGG